MNCIKPIMLKSGLLVPCGKCLLCQSQNRTEKSVLVQLHTESYTRMPLFLTLTYAPEYLPRLENGNPTLCRSDLSAFIKKYKRDFALSCDRLTYFGCGEYGDQEDATFRSHYHLIWFGDDRLHDLWLHDVHFAEDFMSDQWQHGFVDIEEANWARIHYVTKYVMKEEQQCPDGAVKPFCVTSNGIGNAWLKSMQAAKMRETLKILSYNADDIYEHICLSDINWHDSRERLHYLRDAVSFLRPYMPDFRVTLPSGQKAFLPRKLRRKLIGSFEHFSDNPMWIYDFLSECLRTEEYLQVNGDYDRSHDIAQADEVRLARIQKIKDRISKKRFNKRTI